MTIYRGTYYPATGCDAGPRPGMTALVSWYLGAYRNRNAANLGTYSCKRLGSGWSVHAERRAADLGTSPYGGNDSAWGWALANSLRLNSRELGVQLIILGRKVWSCRFPDSGWRTYTGEYHGHMHTELIPSAADALTVSTIQRTIGGGLSVADVDRIMTKLDTISARLTTLESQVQEVPDEVWNEGRTAPSTGPITAWEAAKGGYYVLGALGDYKPPVWNPETRKWVAQPVPPENQFLPRFEELIRDVNQIKNILLPDGRPPVSAPEGDQ